MICADVVSRCRMRRAGGTGGRVPLCKPALSIPPFCLPHYPAHTCPFHSAVACLGGESLARAHTCCLCVSFICRAFVLFWDIHSQSSFHCGVNLQGQSESFCACLELHALLFAHIPATCTPGAPCFPIHTLPSHYHTPPRASSCQPLCCT